MFNAFDYTYTFSFAKYLRWKSYKAKNKVEQSELIGCKKKLSHNVSMIPFKAVISNLV